MEKNKTNAAPGRKVAVCAVTLGRPDMTVKTWKNNVECAGIEFDLFWFDNGSTDEDFTLFSQLIEAYNPAFIEASTENTGISCAFNRMIKEAIDSGYNYICTMANDIIEPEGWLRIRVEAAEAIPNTGVVAIPCEGAHRYSKQEVNGFVIDTGQVIGNYLITRQAVEKVGYFTYKYGNYGPIDLDYCDRLNKVGLRTYYLSNYKSVHLGTPDKNPAQYQEAKKVSLAASWQKYTYAKERYKKGLDIYQDWATEYKDYSKQS